MQIKLAIRQLLAVQECMVVHLILSYQKFKAPKSFLITPILHSLHLLPINECMKYKLVSFT